MKIFDTSDDYLEIIHEISGDIFIEAYDVSSDDSIQLRFAPEEAKEIADKIYRILQLKEATNTVLEMKSVDVVDYSNKDQIVIRREDGGITIHISN